MFSISTGVFALSFLTHSVVATTTIDLSNKFEVENLNSSGSKKVIDAVNQDYTRRFLVLEKGKIVVDYTREGCHTGQYSGREYCNVTPGDTFQSFSVAKSIDSFAFGLLVDAGLLAVDDTLGDIFSDASTWENVTHADYIQGVSVKELLTQTSGLVFDDEGLENTCEPDELPDSCGTSNNTIFSCSVSKQYLKIYDLI